MKLTIGMMVKNEEKNLERCLQSLQPIRDAIDSELIIVDTGSEDNTVEIAKKYTDQLYFHSWNNDFSAMRNTTISYAKGEWFFVIDADEELKEYQSIINFLQSSHASQYGAVAITTHNITDADDPHAFSVLVNFRLFKNDGNFYYTGAVHNQPVFKGNELAMPEAILMHYGYMATDSELMEKKFKRTSEILKKELEKEPENIYYWTQLSITYGMHKDFEEAIQYIEKAYSLLPRKRTPNSMFVFTQMAIIYQITKKYEKLEKICLESLTIKDGYLDIYYYLAESQAVLGKNQEAIANYGKYLELLDKHERQKEKDTTIIEYTLGYKELVYFNLSNLYKQVEEYDKALLYAEQITNGKYLKDNLATIIGLYIKLSKYDELKNYYERCIHNNFQDDFFEILDDLRNGLTKHEQLALAGMFKEGINKYALLCNIIIEDNNGAISDNSKEAISKINLAEFPVYCSDIFYYLIKWQYPLEKGIVDFKEIWISCIFDYINKRRNDLCEKIYCYLQSYTCGNSLIEYKLSKALCRYALLLDTLSDDEYKTVFERYIHDGTAYMQEVYNDNVFVNTLVYDVKNDEEVFLLYMYKARLQEESLSAEYVQCLRTALQAFPAMKRGVEMLLQKMKNLKNNEENNEFEIYQQEIKNTIKQLIDSGKMDEAKAILNEYKIIVPNDLESVLLESKILLN